MPTVLITDAQERAMLAASRSLHRAGWAVHAAASERPAPGHWSRACARRFRVPDPRESPAQFVENLARVLDDHGEDVLIPGSDASLLAISANRDRVDGRSHIGLPDDDAVARSLSKIALNEAARRAGFEVPETVVCEDASGALAAAKRLGYPVVVKPERSVFELDGRLHQRKAAVVYDQSSLAELLTRLGGRCLVQISRGFVR